MSVKTEKLENQLIQELSYIINYEVKDKDVRYVTVTACTLSPDLSYAKVYFTNLIDTDREKVTKALKDKGIRVECDYRAEKIGYKIREARLQKLPYMLVVGAQEQETGKVSVRSRFAGDEGQKDLKDFIIVDLLLKQILIIVLK